MLSTDESIRAEQARVDDFATLIDQYGDVAARANTVRFNRLARQVLDEGDACGLTGLDSWGGVRAALVRAESHGLDPATVQGESWNERDLGDADDGGAVMSYRIERRIEAVPAQQGETMRLLRPYRVDC